ncbi:MAG: DUF502 domain-containing protein, partial [Proteobacteria bacterium]|nr:DUF502 domain-containing protein [Pseudomonadota bacterium]
MGFLAANLLGRSLIRLGETILDRMPVVRGIYKSVKQIFETVFSQSGTGPPGMFNPLGRRTVKARRSLFKLRYGRPIRPVAYRQENSDRLNLRPRTGYRTVLSIWMDPGRHRFPHGHGGGGDPHRLLQRLDVPHGLAVPADAFSHAIHGVRLGYVSVHQVQMP